MGPSANTMKHKFVFIGISNGFVELVPCMFNYSSHIFVYRSMQNRCYFGQYFFHSADMIRIWIYFSSYPHLSSDGLSYDWYFKTNLLQLPYFCRIQVRYGSRWGPHHPNEVQVTKPVEILLKPGENIIQLKSSFGWIVNGAQVNTTHMLYSWIGSSTGGAWDVDRHGNKIVYLKGSTYDFYQYGILVSQITAVFDSCDF